MKAFVLLFSFLLSLSPVFARAEVKWVNEGSSSGRFGFDWTSAGVEGLNLAAIPQSSRRGFEKIREHRGELAAGAYVLIPVCPFSSVVPKSYDQRKSSETNPLLDFDGLPDETALTGFRDVLDRGWKQEFAIRDYSDPLGDGLKAAFAENVKLFREFFVWCRKEGLKPVLILPPAAKCFDEIFPPAFLKTYVYDFIAAVKASDVPFLDYWNDAELRRDRNFANALFLNKTGRRLFTARVMKDVVAAFAAPGTVLLDDRGEVALTCANPNGWKFALERLPVTEPGVFEVKFSAHGPKEELPPAVRVEFITEQRDVQFRWTPGNWSVPIPWQETMGDLLARSISLAPVYAWISQADENRLTVSLSEAVRPTLYSGYERDRSGSKLHNAVTFFSRGGTPFRDYEAVIRYDFRDLPYWRTVREGADWIATFPGQGGRTVPASAYEPLWNTWYGYHVGYTAADVLSEAKIARDLGIRTIMYDMGWDRHGSTNSSSFAECGDWRPDPQDFPDMKGHVAEIHAMGLKAMLWCGPSLMGRDAKNLGRFRNMLTTGAPWICGSCHALDPRFPEVRNFLTDVLVGGFRDWNVDGWKIDFIQEFHEHGEDRVPKEGMNGRDFRYVGDATRAWLEEAVEKCRAVKPEAMFEYMMAYAGPVCQRAATQIRAADCPADAQYNRNQTVRLRLLCGDRCSVLADMFTWSREEKPEDCALQMISTLHAVPIYGMRLTELTEDQKRAVRHWVRFAREHADTLYRGDFRPHGAAANYPLIEMSGEREAIVTVHQPGQCATVAAAKPTWVVNGTGDHGLVIFSAETSEAEIFDVFGERVGKTGISSGYTGLRVPAGGYAKILPLDYRDK